MARQVVGVILAGGHSSRFGSDKAFALWHGVPFLKRVGDALRGVAEGLLVLTPRGSKAEPYARVLPGASIVPDARDAAGPVEALKGAQALLLAPITIVAACDAPGLTAPFARRLVLTAQGRRTPAVASLDARPLNSVFAIPTHVLLARLPTATRLEDLLRGAEEVPCGLEGLNVNEPPPA